MAHCMSTHVSNVQNTQLFWDKRGARENAVCMLDVLTMNSIHLVASLMITISHNMMHTLTHQLARMNAAWAWGYVMTTTCVDLSELFAGAHQSHRSVSVVALFLCWRRLKDISFSLFLFSTNFNSCCTTAKELGDFLRPTIPLNPLKTSEPEKKLCKLRVKLYKMMML